MGRLLLMPTPNWLVARPIDINKKDASIALSVIGTIYITENLFNSYKCCIKDAHGKRIQALAFHNSADGELLLASCAEDLEVKVWNVQATTTTATATASLLASHKHHLVNG
jgi:WD40 repeat protein